MYYSGDIPSARRAGQPNWADVLDVLYSRNWRENIAFDVLKQDQVTPSDRKILDSHHDLF